MGWKSEKKDSWLNLINVNQIPPTPLLECFSPPIIKTIKIPFLMGNGGSGGERDGNFLHDFDPISFVFFSLLGGLANQMLRELATVLAGCHCNNHTWEEANHPWDLTPSSSGQLAPSKRWAEALVVNTHQSYFSIIYIHDMMVWFNTLKVIQSVPNG